MANNFGLKCCKTKPTSRGSSHDLVYSLCVFQMKEPHSKGDSLPKPEPRTLWGGEDTGTGSAAGRAAGLSRQRALLWMHLYSGLKCFVSQPSLIEGCFLCQNETQALTHWAFAGWKQQQQPHLRAWLQRTVCSTKAPEELCHDIMRKNNRILADLFNKLSGTFQHWPVVWAEFLLMHLRAKVATQWPLVCMQENSAVHKDSLSSFGIDRINWVCRAHMHSSYSVCFLLTLSAFYLGLLLFGGMWIFWCVLFLFISLCLIISLDIIYKWKVYQINLDCWCCG